MSSIYNSIPDNISPPTGIGITGVTNVTNPVISVSFPLPASFVTGVKVSISGVQGALGVNGTWTATPTGPSSFRITTSAPGAYTSGGVAQPVYLAAVTLPGDGDDENAASVTTPMIGLADQVGYLALATGIYKVAYYFATSGDNDFGVTANIASGAALTWLSWPSGLPAPFAVTGGGGHAIPVHQGDIILVRTDVSFGIANSAEDNDAYLHAIHSANYAPGASPTFTRLPGSGVEVVIGPPPGGNDFTWAVPVHLAGSFVCTTTGFFDWTIKVQKRNTGVATGGISLYSSFFAECVVLRATGVPQ